MEAKNSQSTVTVDFTATTGPVKPMHAVNNGPVYKFAADQRITNIEPYRQAGIPYARLHDANLLSTYGAPHTVDVYAIFPCFDADENDPASYEFTCTDNLLKVFPLTGTKVFYRLGVSIEHQAKKFNTAPPKDFLKWAKICEHIIRHYTEGWADGFHYDIEYWEIWNEPENGDCCWSGTREEFIAFFSTVYRHLKTAFPHLKLGGPATAGPWFDGFTDKLLTAPGMKIDFYSWHTYCTTPEQLVQNARMIREKLDALGLVDTESILDEWNYVSSWFGEEWERSLLAERGLKGSSFIAGCMCALQYEPLDLLMYYDARPCGMNGMFEAYTLKPLKGYTPFHMFNRLYRLGTSVAVRCGGDLYAAAAKDKGGEGAVMMTHYSPLDTTLGKSVCLKVKGAALGPAGVRAEYFLLDAYHTETPIKEELHTEADFEDTLFMPLHATCLVRITPV